MLGAVAAGALVAASAASAQTDAPQTPAADQPIVPDSQFEKELPSLDPELGKPLEPLEDFSGPPPAVTPEGELVPDAAVPDAELARPLTPIDQFDVATPPPDADGGDDDEGKVEPVRYTLVVEGLDEIGLEGRFRDLSALEDADGEATNGAQISARAKEDELLAVRLLRSEGYYDATALSAIEQLPDQPGQMRVVVSAVPGPRYLFGKITVTGPPTEPPDLAREALKLKTEDPIVAANVEAAEANVRLRLPQQGYPFAEVGLRDILLDPETRHGDYTLPVEPGNRSRFAGFTTEGDLAFGAGHVEDDAAVGEGGDGEGDAGGDVGFDETGEDVD